MCLVFAAEDNVQLRWMQDLIFCVPKTSSDGGRKIVITTVALSSLAKTPKDLFLYYAETIKEPIVDLVETLRNPTYWLNELSKRVEHIERVTDTEVELHHKYHGHHPKCCKFTPIAISPTPELFPQHDAGVQVLAEQSTHTDFPFTKVTLKTSALNNVILRFAFTIPYDSTESTANASPFRFLGPKQIVEIIEQKSATYSEKVNNQSPTGFAKKGVLIGQVLQEQEYLQFPSKNGLYHLLLCAQPPHELAHISAGEVEYLQTFPVKAHWLRKDHGNEKPGDFDVDEEAELHMTHYEATSNKFNIVCMVKA